MDSESAAIKSAEDRKVPDHLLQRLHAANQQFHQAKTLYDQAVADTELGRDQRLEQAEEQMRVAEREVEKITLEIHGSLKPSSVEPKH